jgi:hypothetical protein
MANEVERREAREELLRLLDPLCLALPQQRVVIDGLATTAMNGRHGSVGRYDASRERFERRSRWREPNGIDSGRLVMVRPANIRPVDNEPLANARWPRRRALRWEGNRVGVILNSRYGTNDDETLEDWNNSSRFQAGLPQVHGRRSAASTSAAGRGTNTNAFEPVATDGRVPALPILTALSRDDHTFHTW